ncbi:putative membrane protein [Rhodoblastus sphagnicola]|nr:putative membrane protein [Rhodoblastus sphagnicola]
MIAVFAVMGGVAMAQSPSTSEKLGINSALGIAPATQDFVTEAANSGEFEIQSSKLALDRGDQVSKTFAEQMITDHQKVGSQLKALVQSKNIKVTIPDGVSSSQQSMLDKLKSLKGADFDKKYRDDQYSGHKSTLALFERYAKSGDNPDLKQWAEQTAPALQRHLKMAQELNGSASN